MNLLALLLPLLALRAAATQLQARPAPTPGKVHDSADGRFRWVEGEDSLMITDPGKRKPRRVPLPLTARPAPGARRVLFADRGRFFCVVDEYDSEIGLHLDVRRGAKAAKALVMRSVLHLVDDGGRVLWSRDMPDKYAVGSSDAARVLRVTNGGTLALLLQDVDPYAKARPLLLVLSKTGRELLRLDYASWTRIDEFALSADGKRLALRGWGLIPEDESWGKAVGYHVLGTKTRWTRPLPALEDARLLRIVDGQGWACCVREGGRYLAFDPAGEGSALDAAAMRDRFGVAP